MAGRQYGHCWLAKYLLLELDLLADIRIVWIWSSCYNSRVQPQFRGTKEVPLLSLSLSLVIARQSSL